MIYIPEDEVRCPFIIMDGEENVRLMASEGEIQLLAVSVLCTIR